MENKQAQAFCEKYNIKIDIVLSPTQSAPIWSIDGSSYGLKYDITISREDKSPWTFPFWDCIANKEKQSAPAYYIYNNSRVYPSEAGYFHLDNKRKKELAAGKYAPTVYDVLTAITKYAPGSFDDFVSDYGYNSFKNLKEYQSIMSIYLAAQDEYSHAATMFSDCMDELRLIN